MKKAITCFSFFLIWFFFLFTVPVQGSEEFITRYEVAYQFHSSGLCTVNQKISLTNKLSNIYATEYSLKIDTLDIRNVKAWDDLGPLQTSVSRVENATQINLVFNEKVVGKNERLDFNLEYQSYDFAIKKGQVWEIMIPRLSSPEQIDEYHLVLNIPPAFGPAGYFSPQPTRNEPPFYYFDKQASAKGISATFGQYQVFDFTITYHLKNPTHSSEILTISLPPDTAYQRVVYQKIEPSPKAIKVDQDGNWLGQYEIEPQKKVRVTAIGSVQIFLQPTFNSQNGLFSRDDYLKPDQYWEVNHPEIQVLAQKLKTPRAIYNFVIRTLDYNYQKIDNPRRIGALQALNNPDEALCMEFTDLFIALSRAAGIPAREINGYAYTENPQLKPLSLKKDILHAWPEYWDESKKNWVPVDPTWGETTGGLDFFNKLDLNHFVLVIHGQKSDYPYPPGQGFGKNIQIDFGQKLITPREDLGVEFALPEQVMSGRTVSGEVKIINRGNVAFHGLDLLIENRPEKIKVLPPFASQVFPIEVEKTAWWQSQKKTIKVLVNQQPFQKEITVKPFFYPLINFLTKIFLSVKNLIK